MLIAQLSAEISFRSKAAAGIYKYRPQNRKTTYATLHTSSRSVHISHKSTTTPTITYLEKVYKHKTGTSVRVGDGHLPDADVAEDVAQEFAERKRHNELEVVRPGDASRARPPHAPDVEQRAGQQRDRRQLDHGHRDGVGEAR